MLEVGVFFFICEVPWLVQLVASLLLQRLWFDPGSFDVRFMADKVVMGLVFLRLLRYFLVIIILLMLIPIFILILFLSGRQVG